MIDVELGEEEITLSLITTETNPEEKRKQFNNLVDKVIASLDKPKDELSDLSPVVLSTPEGVVANVYFTRMSYNDAITSLLNYCKIKLQS